ncbi:MAG: hypothetical protein AAF628_10180 [Planctomycetota bacterium]
MGHDVARSTIPKSLKEHGIKPAPERPTSWRTFLASHADAIAGADFFTTDVWTGIGLVTRYVLFVIKHSTRAVQVAGVTTNPDAAFMAQVARNLTDCEDGFLRTMRDLVVDRDAKFVAGFADILREAGVELVRTAYRAPNMSAIASAGIDWLKEATTAAVARR